MIGCWPRSFEGGSVGGEARLRALLGLQAELLEENAAQLLRRVDDKGLAGVVLDLLLQPAHLGLESDDELAQVLDVDPHTDLLHAGQHSDQGAFDVVVEGEEVARCHGVAEGGRQPGHGDGSSAGVLRRTVLAAIQVELTGGGGVAGLELEAEVADGELFEEVLRLARVDEVGGDRRVQVEGTDVDPERVEGAHELLGPVGLERRPTRTDEGRQSGGHLLVVEEAGVEILGDVGCFSDGQGKSDQRRAALDAFPRSGDGDGLLRPRQPLQAGNCLLDGCQPLQVDIEGPRR